jgi:serine/threonine protein kinase
MKDTDELSQMPDAALEAEPPTILAGRYCVVRPLGRGGMGGMYLVRDALAGDAPRAVKELLPEPGASPAELAQARERFAREARLLASLSHAALPHVYEFFNDDGHSYLVMEYIEGETLEQRVQREGAQSEAQALAWAGELCAVLEYLHARTPPVVFRDVAPDNVMVDGAGHIHLIDFGIARIFNPVKQTDTLRFGKVGYAPPEQFGGGQTTPKSDLFALGATLHYALTGRDPAQTPFVFPPLRELNPTISPSTEQAVAHALQLDPAQRPADARVFATELGIALAPLVLPPRPSALPGELEPAPDLDAPPRGRLVAFRLPPRSNEQLFSYFQGAMLKTRR